MAGSVPRAVVADDSHFMRSVISDILEDGGIDVVTQARNGREAVEAVEEHEPDVVTMDVEMPEMDGIEATERIMAEQPTPVLMLSAHTDENADVTFEALDKGAVDFFTKPGGEVSMEMSRLKDQLVDIVSSVAGMDVSGGRPTAGGQSGQSGSEPASYAGNPTLVVGSSTGGPKMVEEVLSALPLSADLRILVVQHMPEGFTGRFAERIDARSDYDVRPAVDVTMETAADTVDDALVGVILTGMGEDGAAGIREIKAAGGRTIAQDEATSAVYGMPKRAVETGCVDDVLPIGEIAGGIVDGISTEVNS